MAEIFDTHPVFLDELLFFWWFVVEQFLRRPGGPEQNAPLDPGVREYERKGYLLKEGGGSGKGRWQQRFFLLRDFKLEYYDKEPSNAGEKVRPELPPAPALDSAQTHAG